jgi:PEP-CTERM motif
MGTLMTSQQFDLHLLCGPFQGAPFVIALAAALLSGFILCGEKPVTAGQITLVDETFDGYHQFPDEKPANDPVNLGVPTQAKGADSALWLAGRFEAFDDDPLAKDVGVQHIGGGGDNTPVGRAGDEAGLVLRLDLAGLTNVTLDFKWRTFLADPPDRFVLAYYVGDGSEFQAGGLGMPNGYYDWYSDPDLGGGVMDLDGGTSNSWYVNNWVELMRTTGSDHFTSEHFDLPVENDVVYVAFWMDDGNMDFVKIDDVQVMADYIPEPSTGVLSLVAAALLGWFRRRRN